MNSDEQALEDGIVPIESHESGGAHASSAARVAEPATAGQRRAMATATHGRESELTLAAAERQIAAFFALK